MELVPLRARASCSVCHSKLPPRTEVYWDAEAEVATCTSCAILFASAEGAPAADAPDSEVPAIEVSDVDASAIDIAVDDTSAEVEVEAVVEPAKAEGEVEAEVPEEVAEVDVDIDAPPAWGKLLADTSTSVADPYPDPDPAAASAVDGAALPGAGPAPEPAPGPVPDAEPLPPAAEAPVRPVAAGVSHGITFRGSAAQLAGGVDDPSWVHTELDRGDMGEGRVGQTVEAARIHGLEVLHGFDVASGVRPIDHLVIAVNGLWVVRAQDALTGPLERRDLGDWFSADPRLFVKDEDSTHLIDETRRQVEALRARLGPTSFGDVVVRGVVCYGTAPAGWVNDPFYIANVKVTWRNLLVEPMLDPVMIDEGSRLRLTAMLAADRRRAKIA